MKSIICIVLALSILGASAYGQSPTLLDVRNHFFEESNQIKSLLIVSNDPGIIINMWNSCMTAVLQINAYFYMLGVFDSIKTGVFTEDPTFYLTTWLRDIKKTNELNVRNLKIVPQVLEPRTKVHIEKLKSHFNDLSRLLDLEINKFIVVRKTLNIRKPIK